MKKAIMILVMFCAITIKLNAQSRTSVAVINITAAQLNSNSEEATDMTRIELEKLNKFSVRDKYEVRNALQNINYRPEFCNSKNCLLQAGKELSVEKVLTGNITKYDKKIVIEFRLINIKEEDEEKIQVDEYLPMEDNLQEMIEVSLQKMFGLTLNEQLAGQLQKKENFDNSFNNPGRTRLVLNGPRIGITYLTGNIARRLTDDKDQGGYEAYPYMTIFGYQHEVQYLNEGNFQALFEFVGVISGLDQNMFNPSISILNGFRSNISGWEFALGPNFSLSPVSKGYYDDNDRWVRLADGQQVPEGKKATEALDRRGTMQLTSSFVFSVGKSFRSGKMNIPLNFFIIPKRDGWRIGTSFGFNAKRREL